MGYYRFYRRLAAGTLTLAGYIQSDGANIVTANNSWPCVCDYNNDGKKDLLVGQEGIGSPCNVYVYLNIGTNAAPVFTDSTPVLLGGAPTTYYRTIPVLLDLDLDGRRDLVMGGWYSDVRFYSNTGTNANPVFPAYTYLVNPDSTGYSNGNPPRLTFTDWDGDGDQDMLTCDYYGSVFLRRNITPTGIADRADRGTVIAGLTAWPSPVTTRVCGQCRLARTSYVRVDVYAADGRRVATPWSGETPAGMMDFTWDVRLIPAGVYLMIVSADGGTGTARITVTH